MVDVLFSRSLITNSLVDLAVNFRSQDENKEKWIIDLNNGEKLTLLVTETDKVLLEKQ